jgi:hypothetical protein
MAAKPKVNMFPDEDKEWGGYKDAVQCIHCRRWMVVDFESNYISDSGKFHNIVLFKELRYERGQWYISNRSHHPNICGNTKEKKQWAKEQGYKSWGQFKRIMARREAEANQAGR